MAKKLSPLTPVNEWPTRKLPQQRFDDEVKKSMNQMSGMVDEINNPFIPTVNEIIDDVNVCVENIELIQAAPGHADTAQKKAQEAAASATKAQQQATIATQKATAAAASAAAAAQSEKDAQTAQSAAETAQAAAEASKNAAATSATTATQKANAAATSATNAQQQATTATQKATAAATSASQAATSATKAQQQATIATQKATAAQSAQEAAEAARDEAQNIAGVGPATPGAIGFVKPDSKTTVTDGAGTITVKDVAIGGRLTDLASARGIFAVSGKSLDCNDLTKSGMYRCYATGSVNTPTVGSASSGIAGKILVIADSAGDYVTQVFYSDLTGSPKVWTRNYDSSIGWRPWRLLLSEYEIGDGIHKGPNGVFSVPEYQGATASDPGVAGLVPPATAAQRNMALLGSGEYGVTGVLTKVGSRSTDGNWIISGLTPYKPLFIYVIEFNWDGQNDMTIHLHCEDDSFIGIGKRNSNQITSIKLLSYSSGLGYIDNIYRAIFLPKKSTITVRVNSPGLDVLILNAYQ